MRKKIEIGKIGLELGDKILRKKLKKWIEKRIGNGLVIKKKEIKLRRKEDVEIDWIIIWRRWIELKEKDKKWLWKLKNLGIREKNVEGDEIEEIEREVRRKVEEKEELDEWKKKIEKDFKMWGKEWKRFKIVGEEMVEIGGDKRLKEFLRLLESDVKKWNVGKI